MAVTDGIKIDNLPALQRALAKLPKEIRAKIEKDVLRKNSKDMALEIAAAAPVRTATLESSIRSGKTPKKYLGEGELAYGVLADRRGEKTGGYYIHLVTAPSKIVVKKGFLRLVMGTRRGNDFVSKTFEKYSPIVYKDTENAVAAELAKANGAAA